MEKINDLLIAELYNCGYFDEDFKTLINKCTYDDFGRIEKIYFKVDYNIDQLLRDFTNIKESKVIVDYLNKSIEDRRIYFNTLKVVFNEEKIKDFDDIFFRNYSNDKIYALFNRINRKTEIERLYPFFYYNDIPIEYRANSRLMKKISFEEYRYDTNSIAYSMFEDKFPVYKEFENEHEEKFYFSASHRTFTSEKYNYYFKIDLPYKISSSYRYLKRNKNRILASRLSKETQKVNKQYKLIVLADIEVHRYEDKTMIIREKDSNYIHIPLFSLLSEVPFEKYSNLLEYLIETKDWTYKYIYQNIVFPIIDMFHSFIEVSINYNKGKLIAPNNFHTQNINLCLDKQLNIVGLSVQDLDSSVDLIKEEVLFEYDCCICYFFLHPLGRWLHKNNMKELTEFQNDVRCLFNKYINNTNDWLFKSESHIFKNLMTKDINNESCSFYKGSHPLYR